MIRKEAFFAASDTQLKGSDWKSGERDQDIKILYPQSKALQPYKKGLYVCFCFVLRFKVGLLADKNISWNIAFTITSLILFKWGCMLHDHAVRYVTYKTINSINNIMMKMK